MSSLWAASTWDARLRCWSQLLEFIETLETSSNSQFSNQDLERLAMLFLQYRKNSGVSAATLLNTASNISACLARVCPDLSKVSLMDMMKIFRRLQVDPLQALPFSPLDYARWVLSLPRRERLAAVLAWVTSARWDDVVRLTRSSVTILGEGWLIHFAETKSSTSSEYRPDSFVPIANPPAWMHTALNSLRADDNITMMNTDQARKSMQCILPSPITIQTFPSCRDHFTAHSPKRGAQTCLWRRAALGPQVALFAPLQIAMLGRHKTPHWPIPTTSVRYAADRFAMGMALGLQHATTYLLQVLSIELHILHAL